MYQFAQLQNFPVLGESFLQLLARHFSHVHKGKRLDGGELLRAFEHLGFRPALMKDLVKDLSAEGSTDVNGALRRLSTETKNVMGWQALLAPMSVFDRNLLQLLAQKKPPLGKEVLQALPKSNGKAVTVAKVRAALDRLKRRGVLRASGGEYVIEDPLLVDYLLSVRAE
jgi:uncharacterized protein